jgi:hypothetical protein
MLSDPVARGWFFRRMVVFPDSGFAGGPAIFFVPFGAKAL